MALTNSPALYGGVTKTLHWLTVLLIFTVIPLGIIAHNWSFDTSEALATKAILFSFHKTVGVTIFFVALARIAWAVSQPKPGLLHADRKVESWLAETVHWTLYAALVIVPLTGWIHHSATTGFAPIWWPFGQTLPFVPKDEGVAQTFAALHIVFERVLVISLLLHIAGALKHHFVDKDVTLKRMLPGDVDAPAVGKHSASTAPMIAAAGAYGLAVIVGLGLGVFAQKSTASDVAALAEVETGWDVTEGTLGISVTQLGSAVEGSFADWTAAIEFAEEPTDGSHGTVEVTIAIGSLSLGSVTDQAMGAEFFDAGNFPTATFTADILPGDGDGYVAEGVLNLRGQESPVTLPFTLTLDGDTATMEGTTTLDRRNYEIGIPSYSDESSVGFPVPVTVTLTAQRVSE
ncbi:cytochrome b/b6 domain-containing protein [Actibacterium sp. 188UL27-1]|uniref:cytochrome b/b6 domain-containing protein n=1 Tax=Actibacterium sp. 188UL27-1 TaxID=2786961 RepID=UPI00195ACA95|nr:cytochrome b/b6 domain-containing protein [Actibacterium sp. 188UL27-1]MBM7068051.1 cytochrome b/b6 domain-containing protein [Actibacterium sp. 188UL27-1]